MSPDKLSYVQLINACAGLGCDHLKWMWFRCLHVLYKVQQHAISNLGICKREDVMALQAFHKT
jgi:hypothetical protein